MNPTTFLEFLKKFFYGQIRIPTIAQAAKYNNFILKMNLMPFWKYKAMVTNPFDFPHTEYFEFK